MTLQGITILGQADDSGSYVRDVHVVEGPSQTREREGLRQMDEGGEHHLIPSTSVGLAMASIISEIRPS